MNVNMKKKRKTAGNKKMEKKKMKTNRKEGVVVERIKEYDQREGKKESSLFTASLSFFFFFRGRDVVDIFYVLLTS